MRLGRLLLLALLLVPALPFTSAGPLFLPPEPESLVEGHTVYAVLESSNASALPYAIPRARLAAPAPPPLPAPDNPPGRVRWFNDQDLLVGVPAGGAVAVLVRDAPSAEAPAPRYPCAGAVLAVAAGDPDPAWGSVVTYLHSYRVRDPQNLVWEVDRWRLENFGAEWYAWSVALRNNGATMPSWDDGVAHCGAFRDSSYAPDAGDHGLSYPDGSGPRSELLYNALLYVPFEHLAASDAPRNHSAGAWERQHDASGCHDWRCPGLDDDAEGNSHAYHPYAAVGASRPDAGAHETRLLDLYYGPWTPPAHRTFLVDDTVGSGARV